MQNFIVLGYVPGTHIQITFAGWLLISAIIVLFGLLVHERKNIRVLVLSWYVNRVIKDQQLA